MPPSVTCFGGVGEIGGNKILLEDSGAKVLLDFGAGFSDGGEYFESGISPRAVNGAGDLFEFGLLPEIPGLYSEQALQNTEVKYQEPTVDAIVLSHYHWDHMGRIPYLDPKIPVYCGETTSLIHEANAGASGSPLEDHDVRKFRTGSRFNVGSMEFIPIHVDHSIPGAYGFVVHTTEGAIAYTGDFRFHGPAGSMTEDFISKAGASKPGILITEGTRVRPGERRSNSTEGNVFSETEKAIKKDRLVFSSFRGNDIDRINTFNEVAKRSGRRLVVSMKTALILESLKSDGGLKVPAIGDEVDVYVRRKKSGKLDDADYYPWERRFLETGVSAIDVKRRQKEVFLHLEVWNFPELIDIKPDRGGAYIHAASEAFNEEGEREEGVIKNWIRYMGFSYHQVHASGHAPMQQVGKLVKDVGAKVVVPVHTEYPHMFTRFRRGENWKLIPPKVGARIGVD